MYSITETTTTTSTATTSNYLSNLGLGYAIAIALGFFLLLSASLLFLSYLCCRPSHSRSRSSPTILSLASSSLPIHLPPQIIFVSESNANPDENDNSVPGLDQIVINSYPKFTFSNEIKKLVHSKNYSNTSCTTCSICLCEYKVDEMLRMMPECRHFFHLCCIDAWLKLNGSCPVCRSSPFPTPLSTPGQEVVPLAHHAADRTRRR